MSMKIWTGIQDFLGLHDPIATFTTSSVSNSISTITATVTAGGDGEQSSAVIVGDHRISASPTITTISDESTSCSSSSSTTPNSALKKRTLAELNDEFSRDSNEEPVRRCSHSRAVHFSNNDSGVVATYHEPPTNSFHSCCTYENEVIQAAYAKACKSRMFTASPVVEHQISCFHRIPGVRQECLSLKGQRVTFDHMECLEEILKRVQFDSLDFEYTFIEDDAAITLAEMLEFYDSTMKLNLSFNKQITARGWHAFFRAIRNCASLQVLNLRYTSAVDRSLSALTMALRCSSSLTCLHVENTALSGRKLLELVSTLINNTVLRELYLGENNLQPSDGEQIYKLITNNTALQILDLRNNQLSDGGLGHICDALKDKGKCEKSALTALVLWNNRITHDSMDRLAVALQSNSKLETLNIGSNIIGIQGVLALKSSLLASTTLKRLGLQATHLNCQCAIILAECLAENKVLVRLDLRDNEGIGSAGLLALHSAMKLNRSITVLNLDFNIATTASSKVKEYHEQFKLYFSELKGFCDRNRRVALSKLNVQSPNESCDEGNDASPMHNVQSTESVKAVAPVKSGSAVSEDTTEGNKDGIISENSKPTKVDYSNSKTVDNSSSDSVASVSRTALEGQQSSREFRRCTRSSSLTCTELVEDINERIAQMCRQSKIAEAGTPFKSELPKSASLSSLPTMSNDSTITVKKVSRRFNVTPSASNPNIYRSVSPRFKIQKVVVPTGESDLRSRVSSMSPSKTLSSTSTSSEEVVANNSSNACSPGGTSVAQRKTPVEEGSTEIYERCKEMAPSARITTKKDEVLTAVTTGISATFSPNSLSSRESACFVMNNSPKEKVSLLASIASTSTADETLTYDKKSKDSFHFSRDIIVSSHVADTESTSLIVPEVSLANASSMIYRLCPGNGVKAFAEVRDEIILNVNGGRTAYISENQKGNVSYTKSSNGMNCSKISSNPSQSESRLAKANANKSGERKIQDLNLGHMNSDEMTIKTLVNDIVNFTSYNMGDLAGIVSPLRTSSLLGSPQSSNSRSGSPLSPIRSMSMNHVEETESDDGVIHSVVRGLIRDVLAKEKELLVASIMKRKKFRTGKMPIIPTDPSP